MIDSTTTGKSDDSLPESLVREMQAQRRQPAPELKVEGWRGSWLSRAIERLIGED